MLSLGIEFSTQSVKLVVLDLDKKTVAYTGSFGYDKTFPQYKTNGGILPAASAQIRHTSPYMMIEALDQTFAKLKADKVDLSQVKVIKADGMQHCTVYSNKSFGGAVSTLQADKGLLEQLKETVSRKTAPIWEDRSTGDEAALLTEALLKHGGVEKLTGNRAELRFPAVQIMKWAKESPDEYRATSSIMLLSAYLTSVLAGKIAPVDTGDGWGTNLNSLDINQPSWNKVVLDTINNYVKQFGLGDDVGAKIGAIDHYDAPVGKVNGYFAKKYGVNPEAIVLTATGDNPATLLGCGGHIVISLGSSYTVNGVMGQIVPSADGEYNVFGYTKGSAMALSCITNGGKLHEDFLRTYVAKSKDKHLDQADWEAYRKLAGSSTLSDDEKIMLPYMFDESVPRSKAGIVRDNFSADDAAANVALCLPGPLAQAPRHAPLRHQELLYCGRRLEGPVLPPDHHRSLQRGELHYRVFRLRRAPGLRHLRRQTRPRPYLRPGGRRLRGQGQGEHHEAESGQRRQGRETGRALQAA
jgi:xylulokinase